MRSMNRTFSRLLAALAVSAVVGTVAGLTLWAGGGTHDASAISVLTVTKTADTNDGVCDADCSLREAIAVAAPGQTIEFDPGLSGGTITETLGGLTISQSLTITGPSGGITVDGTNH